MQLATKYNIIFFSWPLAAAFLLLFTFITGPGSKIWLVVVETETYGTIKVGALGICAGDICLRDGLGYDPGDQLGKIIPQFPAVGICHLITFICLIVGTALHVYFLPRLHRIRDTRLSWIMWIVPACCALFVLICVIMDFALVAQLKNDKALQGLSTGSIGSAYPPSGSNIQNPANSTYGSFSSTNATSGISGSSSYSANATVPGMTPPNNSPAPIPSPPPQKLSLRALANSTIPSDPTINTAATSKSNVTAQGALYLPIVSLLFSLIWLYLGFYFLRKSKSSEETREAFEAEKYHGELLSRKRVREENPVENNYGWYNFGRPAAKETGPMVGQGQGGGFGLGRFAPAWMGGGADKDDAPAGFV